MAALDLLRAYEIFQSHGMNLSGLLAEKQSEVTTQALSKLNEALSGGTTKQLLFLSHIAGNFLSPSDRNPRAKKATDGIELHTAGQSGIATSQLKDGFAICNSANEVIERALEENQVGTKEQLISLHADDGVKSFATTLRHESSKEIDAYVYGAPATMEKSGVVESDSEQVAKKSVASESEQPGKKSFLEALRGDSNTSNLKPFKTPTVEGDVPRWRSVT